MTPAKLKISIGVALAAFVSSLVVAGGATARVPVEPGPSSPVTHQHVRKPAVKKASTRNFGGYPALSGKHVRVDKELGTE